MTDVHALSGAYAIDALDDAERAQFEQHLALCGECRAEVAGLQEAGAELAATTMATPSAALRARVLADVAQVRPLPPVVAPPAGVTDLAAH
ncbi:zf-HC2 domain-containing protein, partial [Nocardioides aquaticus]